MAQPVKAARENKQAHERRIFVEFCRANSIPVLLNSIRQPDPPEPDIVADIEGRGTVAFELVRMNHDDDLVSMNLGVESSAFLSAEFAKLPDPQRSRLATMYDDAHVLLQFSPAANLGQRRQVLPLVWSMLESQPTGAKGFFHNPPIATRASSHLHMVYVSRLARQRGGPLFNSQSASFPYPIQIERVIAKLKKLYTCVHPLELLAYVDRGEMPFESDLSSLGQAVGEHLSGSSFRRVWAFEELLKRATAIQ